MAVKRDPLYFGITIADFDRKWKSGFIVTERNEGLEDIYGFGNTEALRRGYSLGRSIIICLLFLGLK